MVYQILLYTVIGVVIGAVGGIVCAFGAWKIGLAGRAVPTKYSDIPRPTMLKYILFISFMTIYGAAVSLMHGYLLFVLANTFIFVLYGLAKRFYK